jgi:Mrp family chromosome partitioning ATPase
MHTSLSYYSLCSTSAHDERIRKKKQYNPSFSPALTSNSESKAKREAAKQEALKPKTPYVAPTSKPDSSNLTQKEERKRFHHMNPDAKFVLTYDFELRHLLYSERHVGEVLSFPEETIEQLNSLGMFNSKQGFQYMRRPICVVRPNTGLVARQLLAQDVSHLGTKDRRVVVAGKPGTGKSFMLLQMAALALMQKYVVIAVPRGIEISFEMGLTF